MLFKDGMVSNMEVIREQFAQFGIAEFVGEARREDFEIADDVKGCGAVKVESFETSVKHEYVVAFKFRKPPFGACANRVAVREGIEFWIEMY